MPFDSINRVWNRIKKKTQTKRTNQPTTHLLTQDTTKWRDESSFLRSTYTWAAFLCPESRSEASHYGILRIKNGILKKLWKRIFGSGHFRISDVSFFGVWWTTPPRAVTPTKMTSTVTVTAVEKSQPHGFWIPQKNLIPPEAKIPGIMPESCMSPFFRDIQVMHTYIWKKKSRIAIVWYLRASPYSLSFRAVIWLPSDLFMPTSFLQEHHLMRYISTGLGFLSIAFNRYIKVNWLFSTGSYLSHKPRFLCSGRHWLENIKQEIQKPSKNYWGHSHSFSLALLHSFP